MIQIYFPTYGIHKECVKFQSAMNSCWEIVDEIYLNISATSKKSCHLTGSWHPISTNKNPNIWYAKTKSVLKYQAPAMNSCWAKSDRNFGYGQKDSQG